MAIRKIKKKKSKIGLFLKIQELTIAMIFVIFPRKLQFRLKNESFEISWNSA